MFFGTGHTATLIEHPTRMISQNSTCPSRPLDPMGFNIQSYSESRVLPGSGKKLKRTKIGMLLKAPGLSTCSTMRRSRIRAKSLMIELLSAPRAEQAAYIAFAMDRLMCVSRDSPRGSPSQPELHTRRSMLRCLRGRVSQGWGYGDDRWSLGQRLNYACLVRQELICLKALRA